MKLRSPLVWMPAGLSYIVNPHDVRAGVRHCTPGTRDLACRDHFTPVGCSADYCSKNLEIACGQVLLVPFVRLAQGELEIGVTRLDIEAYAGASHVRFRARLLVPIIQ